MGYRCASDLFNYCSDKPEWGKPPKTPGVGLYPAGGNCKLDPKTCGKHQAIVQQLEGVVLPKGNSYRHTQAAKAKPKKARRRVEE